MMEMLFSSSHLSSTGFSGILSFMVFESFKNNTEGRAQTDSKVNKRILIKLYYKLQTILLLEVTFVIWGCPSSLFYFLFCLVVSFVILCFLKISLYLGVRTPKLKLIIKSKKCCCFKIGGLETALKEK